MRQLNGAELADYMKERQAKQVRHLRQSCGVVPKLVILRDSDNPVIGVYVRMKMAYGEDIGVEVEDRLVKTRQLAAEVERVNRDESVHGVIVQLPLVDPGMTDEVTSKIRGEKDVDGLGDGEMFDSATATAVTWLLAAYGVELKGRKIAIVGYGKLVGAPLAQIWGASGYDLEVFRRKDADRLATALKEFDVIVSATGVAGLITNEMVKEGAVVVDAGTASEKGVIKGDVTEDVRARKDVMVTPKKGGVGPLTIVALFDGVLRATEYYRELTEN